MNTYNEKKEQLINILKSGSTPAIAFSGGVDSSLLLYLATKLRNGDALGIIGVTQAQSDGEIEKAVSFAREHMLPIEIVNIDVFATPQVAQNHKDRCYHCKKAILQAIKKVALKNKCSVIYDGTIADDTKEFRPGFQALTEENIKSPLKECGFTKTNVRNYACDLELPIWNKPSKPCLLTRFPYNMSESINSTIIKQIEDGEKVLDFICKHNFRLRWEGKNWARIEASKEDMANIIAAQEGLLDAMTKIGFSKLTLDLRPFKSGSFDRE